MDEKSKAEKKKHAASRKRLGSRRTEERQGSSDPTFHHLYFLPNPTLRTHKLAIEARRKEAGPEGANRQTGERQESALQISRTEEARKQSTDEKDMTSGFEEMRTDRRKR